MTGFDIDRIVQVIFEEVRKMPGKDLKIKLTMIRLQLDKRFNDIMDTLSRAQNDSKDIEPLKRDRENDSQIK